MPDDKVAAVEAHLEFIAHETLALEATVSGGAKGIEVSVAKIEKYVRALMWGPGRLKRSLGPMFYVLLFVNGVFLALRRRVYASADVLLTRC